MSLVLRSDDLPGRSTTSLLRRTARPSRTEDEPTVVLGVQAWGTTIVAQGSHQAVLRPGDMVVYDSTRPHTVLSTDRSGRLCFEVPRSALALPQGSIDAVAGLRIGPDTNLLAATV